MLNRIEIHQNMDDLKRDAKSFMNDCQADILIVYSIRNHMAFNIFSIHDEQVAYNFSEMIDFTINKDSLIFHMYHQNEVIINKEEYMPAVKDAKYEIYIPMTFNDKIIACIYLGSFKNQINIDFCQLNELISKYAYALSKMANEKIMNNILIKNAIFIHELFNEKSQFMVRHIYNVALWATEIAKRMNYSNEEIKKIYLAALMHDIGKIYIDKNVLNKEGKLTNEEYNEMQKHVEIGYNFSKDLFILDTNAEIPIWIYQHHEKWDGTGYPNQLKEEEITKEGRILKVADALDAILSERSYKEQKDFKEAILELKRCKGRDFDPEIADIAIEILKERLNYLNNKIEDVFLPAKIIIKTKEEDYYLDGFLTNQYQKMTFDAVKPIKEIEKKDIVDIVLSVEKLNVIFEYIIKFEKVNEYKLKISEIVPKETDAAFGLLWVLYATLIIPSTKESKSIRITRISGNNIMFHLENEQPLEKDQLYIVVVQFDDGTKIPLTGKITYVIKMHEKVYYKFDFVGIQENYRDEVFRQIFRKQIYMKKMLSDIVS